MQQQVILVTCPRCNAQYVREPFGAFENIERYTRDGSAFRPVPNDWLYVRELGGHLCPNCSGEFKYTIAGFMGDHKNHIIKSWQIDV